MHLKIQEASEEAQREVEQAELLLNHVLIPSSKVNYLKPILQLFVKALIFNLLQDKNFELVAEKKETYRNLFSANCFDIKRTDLVGHTDTIYAIEFSDDGSFLASGGCDEIVRLWPDLKSTENEDHHIVPIEIETRHESPVFSLAISPDNNRLFSGGYEDGKIFIHNIQTLVISRSVI